MTLKLETKTGRKIEVGVNRHNDGGLCLQLEIEDTHITLSTHSYKPTMQGNRTDIAMFSMTKDEIQAIGEAILKANAAPHILPPSTY